MIAMMQVIIESRNVPKLLASGTPFHYCVLLFYRLDNKVLRILTLLRIRPKTLLSRSS